MLTPQSNRPIFKVSLLVALLAFAFAVTSLFPSVMWAMIISALLTFLLRPIVRFLELRVGMTRAAAILVVFLAVGGSMALLADSFTPWLVARAGVLYEQFHAFPFEQELSKAADRFAGFIPFLKPSSFAQETHAFIQNSVESIKTGIANLPSEIIAIISVPVLSYFLLAEGDIILKKIIELVPNKYFEMTLNVLHKIQRDLVGYLRGWILDSIIVGLLSIVGYIIIGVDYSILLGIIAGIANLIPYVGPVVGAVPAVAIAATQYGDFRMFVPITFLTIIIQTLDNIIIQPLSFAKTVDMNPLTVAVLLFVGNVLMGVGGMLLAIPIATILKVSAQETYWGLQHYRITAS